jgi:putative ABC transport system substrate-binding protein
LVFDDAFLDFHRQAIASHAIDRRLPTIFGYRLFVEGGGLMSYGPDLSDQFRRSGKLVDRILKGAKPGDLPVEQPAKFELVINLKTMKALGITIPQSILARADDVIR